MSFHHDFRFFWARWSQPHPRQSLQGYIQATSIGGKSLTKKSPFNEIYYRPLIVYDAKEYVMWCENSKNSSDFFGSFTHKIWCVRQRIMTNQIYILKRHTNMLRVKTNTQQARIRSKTRKRRNLFIQFNQTNILWWSE